MEIKKNGHGAFSVKDNVRIQRVCNMTGDVLDDETYHNLIVDSGLTRLADLIGKFSTSGFDNIAIGTGAVAPTNGDTTLGTESKRAVATSITKSASNQVQYQHLFTFVSGESFNITEAGLFDAGVSGTMLNRLTFAGKSVDVNTDLSVTITITINRP